MAPETIPFTAQDFYNPYRDFDRFGNHSLQPDPYALHYQTPSGQLVTVVSVTHNYNPDSPEVERICSAWRIHVANSEPKNRESLCEGNPPPLPNLDPTSLIEWGSERALQLYLAQTEGTPVRPLDTDNRTEFNAVLAAKLVSPAAVLYYATLRHLTHSPFEAQVEGREQLLNKALERYKTYLPEAQEFSTTTFEELHRHIFNRPSAHDLFDPLFAFDQTVSFWLTDTEVQKVAILWNDYRDRQQIIKRIEGSVNDGKSPFAVMGWQHVERLKPRLQEIGRLVLASSLRPGSRVPIISLINRGIPPCMPAEPIITEYGLDLRTRKSLQLT